MDTKTITFLKTLLNDRKTEIDRDIYDFLCSQTIQFLPNITSENKELKNKIDNDRLRQIKKYYIYLNDIKNLNFILESPIILKGLSASKYYSHGYDRAIGDIDFILKDTNEEKVLFSKDELVKNGYELEEPTVNARHISFNKDKQHYEMHRYFSRKVTEIDFKIDELIQHSPIKEECLDGLNFLSLDDFQNGIILLSHIEHHLSTGLGLRQIVDFYYFYLKVLVDYEKYRDFMLLTEKYNFDILANTIINLCIKYLGGVRKEYIKNVDEELTDELFEIVYNNGNFGRSTNLYSRKTNNAIISGLSYKDLMRKGIKKIESNNAKIPKQLAPFYQVFVYLSKTLKRKKPIASSFQDIKNTKKLIKLLKRMKLK